MLIVCPAHEVTLAATILVVQYKRAGTVVGQLIYAQVEVYEASMVPVSGVSCATDP